MKAIEIGCWKGGSAGLICKVTKEERGILYCIDPWTNENMMGIIPDNMSDVYDKFIYNINYLKLIDAIKIYRESSLTAFGHFEDESIDFCFIDGIHLYNHVYYDIKNFFPKIKKGGIICGHDLNLRYEELNNKQRTEVNLNKNINFTFLESVGKQAHCGVAKAVFDNFGSNYKNVDKPTNSLWWKFK